MPYLRRTATALGAAALGALAWSVAVEPWWLQVVRFRVPVPRLPVGWAGRRVAVLSDFQVGCRGAALAPARRAVAVALRERVDLALFAGDFVYHAGRDHPRVAADLLRPLAEAGVPTFAVFGNHDYRINLVNGEPDLALAGAVEAACRDAGVRVLRNEHVAVPAPGGGGPLHVVGVDSEWAGLADVDRAFAGLDAQAPRVVLLHNPDTFPRLPAHAAPLTVGGHTHGGQVRLLPVSGEVQVLGTTFVLDGWASRGHGAEGNRLYVNRGIGFSWLPMRLGARPELTIIELMRTQRDDTPTVEHLAGSRRTAVVRV